jgi:hypothetical protein
MPDCTSPDDSTKLVDHCKDLNELIPSFRVPKCTSLVEPPDLLIAYNALDGLIKFFCPTPQNVAHMRAAGAGRAIDPRNACRWFARSQDEFDRCLYLTRDGCFILVGVDGSCDLTQPVGIQENRELTRAEAVAWLHKNHHELPAVLMGCTIATAQTPVDLPDLVTLDQVDLPDLVTLDQVDLPDLVTLDQVDLPDLVTLDQAAALVHKSKRTLERYKTAGTLPAPFSEPAGGQAHLWDWRNLGPWLEKQFKIELPKKYPSIRRYA